MATEVELFEFQDVPGRETVRAVLDAYNRAQMVLGGRYAPQLLGARAIPVGIPSSGSVAANGALSGLTALATTYSAGIYLYFPSGAVFAGSVAGLYWTVMSSTTAGTIYADRYTGGWPSAPVAPTPISAAGPGAYTQTTGSTLDLYSLTLPAGMLGLHGGLLSTAVFSVNNSANNKTVGKRFNGSLVTTTALTTSAATRTEYEWRARGAQNSQIGYPSLSSPYGTTTGAPNFTTVDTSLDVSHTWTGNLALATDYIVLETVRDMIIPSF